MSYLSIYTDDEMTDGTIRPNSDMKGEQIPQQFRLSGVVMDISSQTPKPANIIYSHQPDNHPVRSYYAYYHRPAQHSDRFRGSSRPNGMVDIPDRLFGAHGNVPPVDGDRLAVCVQNRGEPAPQKPDLYRRRTSAGRRRGGHSILDSLSLIQFHGYVLQHGRGFLRVIAVLF